MKKYLENKLSFLSQKGSDSSIWWNNCIQYFVVPSKVKVLLGYIPN